MEKRNIWLAANRNNKTLVIKMSSAINQLDFISFCIEMYADKKGISGQTVVKQFDMFGILEYLSDNYEVLHTQGMGYVLPLIDELMDEFPKTQ
jgi:hypothetical protein